MLTPGIRAVFFDAVGTLIEPDPPVAEVYAAAGRRHGCKLSLDKIASRFRSAFRVEEQVDAVRGGPTSEERELQRWRNIVGKVFPERNEEIFRDLYEYFAQASAWRTTEGTAETLQALAARGLTLGLASNFDHRLHSIATGMPELAPATHRIISAEVGWLKPSPRFFEAVIRAAGCKPDQVLFVGDQRINDYTGANAAGLRGVLLDSGPEELPGVRRIRKLNNLLE